MPNPSSIAASLTPGNTNDVAISPDGSLIFAAGSDGNLRVYDSLTGALEKTWHVGMSLGGIDISPDGSFLMATELTPLGGTYSDNWTNDQTVTTTYKVDLSTGAVTSFPVTVTADEYVFNDVAVLADGNVVLSEQELPGWSGWVPAWYLNLTTGTYTKLSSNSSHRMSDFLSVTSDGADVLYGENNISDASLAMFQTGSGFVATHQLYQDGVSGYNSGVQAISGPANMVAQGLGGGTINIYNLSLHYQLNISTYVPQLAGHVVSGLAFDASGQNLYILDGSADNIIQVSTSTWKT